MGKRKPAYGAVAMSWDPDAPNDKGTRGSYVCEMKETQGRNRRMASSHMFSVCCAIGGPAPPNGNIVYLCFLCTAPGSFANLPGHTPICRSCWDAL